MVWGQHTRRLQERADAQARTLGPVIMELRAKGLSVDEVVAELNRRGYRGVKGGMITRGILESVRERWLEIQRRAAG